MIYIFVMRKGLYLNGDDKPTLEEEMMFLDKKKRNSALADALLTEKNIFLLL